MRQEQEQNLGGRRPSCYYPGTGMYGTGTLTAIT
jgi:hypothetical protein